MGFFDLFKKKNQAVGQVIHYFDKIQVAVVALSSSLKIGDKIKVKRSSEEFEDMVGSMQINHENVESAKKGEEVAIKLVKATKAGALVYKV